MANRTLGRKNLFQRNISVSSTNAPPAPQEDSPSHGRPLSGHIPSGDTCLTRRRRADGGLSIYYVFVGHPAQGRITGNDEYSRVFGERLDRGIILACTVFSSVVILGLLPLAIRRYGTTPDNARYFMGFFHILLWVVVGGLAMRKWRQPLIALMRRYEGRPKSAFIAFSVLLACIEEALACLMTNLGRLFGDPTGQVYITASANYLDLAFLHSVIVIVPQVAIWSWILERYRFTSSRLFVLFGVQGGLAEIAFAGMQPALFPTWLLVYALMTWLPYQAFEPALERARIRKNPGFLIQILSLVLVQAGCILFSLAFLAISYGLFGHPLSHFPK